jgi:hypothetical protein
LNLANPFDNPIALGLFRVLKLEMHDIVGFAGTKTTLMRLRELWPYSRLFQLAAGSDFVFLPIDDMNSFEPDHPSETIPLDEFWHEKSFLPSYIEWFACLSETDSLVWLKTAFNGGAGYQAAILWTRGAHIFGPEVKWSGDEAESSEMPINRALRRLGVRSTDKRDEFDVFGLGAYRNYQDLVACAKEVATATSRQSE